MAGDDKTRRPGKPSTRLCADVNSSTRSRSKSGLRLSDTRSREIHEALTESKPPRSRSLVRLVGLPSDTASDVSVDIRTTGSVSSLSAGTARPSRAKKKKNYASTGDTANRILEEPEVTPDSTLPLRSNTESQFYARVEQDKTCNIVATLDTKSTNAETASSQKEKGYQPGKKLFPAHRPQIPRQGRKQSIDNSVSSLTICSRFHADDWSLASSQKSRLRRAFSSPKLYLDGPCDASYPSHEDYDDE